MATLENSFTGFNSIRKEFLPFKKSYTGPGTLNSNFTLDSKIAIEIGTDLDEQTGLDTVSSLALTNAKSYQRYRQLATFNDNVINLGNQFVFELNSLTSTGDYLFTLEVGSLKEVVTVRVLPSTPEVDLSVLTRPEDAGTADVVELNTINVTEKYFFTLGADGKYYGNLGWDSPETTGTNEGKITADLSLLIKNMDLDDVPYTVSISYPSRTEVFSNVLVEGAASNLGIYNAIGGDGHLNAPYLLFLATGKAQSNSATGTFGTNTVYNTAAGVVGGTTEAKSSNLYAKSFSRLDIEEAGTYKITITVNGVSDSVELVVGKRPTLTVDSVTNAVLFDGVYLAKDGTADLKVTFNVKASNLPAVTYFRIFDSFISGSDDDFYEYTTESNVSTARTAIEADRLSVAAVPVATASLQMLSLAFNATTGLFGIEITVPAAAASGDRIRKTVGIYTRSTNYLGTQFTYNLIGEFDVLIWNNVKPTN